MILVVLFQNCGEPQHTNLTTDSAVQFSGSCDTSLMTTFNRTYYSFFKNRCAKCHDTGPGIGLFANKDFQTAFLAFNSLGRSRVERNILNAGHQPTVTGPQNQGLVDQHSAAWATAENEQVACAQSRGEPTFGARVLTIHKTNPMIVQRMGQGNPWVAMTWDLESEMSDSADVGKYRMIASIEIRAANTPTRYEFRNPTLRLKTATGTYYLVHSLLLSINNAIVNDITTYKLAKPTIFTTTAAPISPGSSTAIGMVMATTVADTFALSFGSITPTTELPTPDPTPNPTPLPLPTSVTHAQLVSTTVNIGVFRNACLRCHSGANISAGLDLSSATASAAQAALIVQRMNDAAAPMPPAGQLSARDRDIVRIWQMNGAPP